MNWNRGIRLNEEKWSLEKTSVRKRKEKGERTKRGEGREENSGQRTLFCIGDISFFWNLPSRRFIRFSSIEPRNTFRHRGDQKNEDETISKGREGSKVWKDIFSQIYARVQTIRISPVNYILPKYRKCRANTIFN